MLAVAFLVVLRVGAAPLAQTDGYAEATRLYDAVELDAAQTRFNDVLPLAETDAERAVVHAWIGLIHAQLGRTPEARASFDAAVKLDPAVKLPTLAPPEIVALLERARAAAAPAPVPAKPPAHPAADPQPPAESAASARESGPSTIAVGFAGAGAALAAAGLVTLVVGLYTVEVRATDPDIFNSDARDLLATGYTEYAVGGALAGAGVLLAAGGAALWALE